MRILKKALPLWGAFFVALSSPAYPQCESGGGDEQVSVAYVYDGDTVRLKDGRKVRLIGLNAPEVAKEGVVGEPFARSATSRLKELLARGEVSLTLGVDKQDRYKRWLGHLYVGHDLVAERLLKEGLAFHIAVPPNLMFLDCLKQAELTAVRARKGLWELSPWREISSLKGGESGFRLLEGRITAVKAIKAGWILEIDDLLAVKLGRRVGSELSREGGMAGLEGQNVRIRGWIRPKSPSAPSYYQPWFMTLRHKAHIVLSTLDSTE